MTPTQDEIDSAKAAILAERERLKQEFDSATVALTKAAAARESSEHKCDRIRHALHLAHASARETQERITEETNVAAMAVINAADDSLDLAPFRKLEKIRQQLAALHDFITSGTLILAAAERMSTENKVRELEAAADQTDALAMQREAEFRLSMAAATTLESEIEVDVSKTVFAELKRVAGNRRIEAAALRERLATKKGESKR